VKLHTLEGVELLGKVLFFDILPLDPALKGGAYRALAGQGDKQFLMISKCIQLILWEKVLDTRLFGSCKAQRRSRDR
jgi:hypothetical protein